MLDVISRYVRKARKPNYSACELADWLNARNPSIAPLQRAVAEYIRFINAGRSGPFPKAAQPLFVKPIRARLRSLGRQGLDLAPVADRDYAAFSLRDVFNAGLLGQVRECRECRKWFFAKNPKRDFCSEKCRVRWWQKTPAGKKARREYMRDLRMNLAFKRRERKRREERKRLRVAESIVRELGK